MLKFLVKFTLVLTIAILPFFFFIAVTNSFALGSILYAASISALLYWLFFKKGSTKNPEGAPQTAPPVPTRSTASRNGQMTGFEPSALKDVSLPWGNRVIGTPAKGLVSSNLNASNVALGATGEKVFAKALVKTDLHNRVDNFWSVRMPRKNEFVPDDHFKTDVDCIISVGNKILLLDMKYYASGDVTYRNCNDGKLRAFDNQTGEAIGDGYSLSKNMLMAFDRFKNLFPNKSVEAYVVFIPTDKGAAQLDNVFWPGNVPGVNLLDMLNYIDSLDPQDGSVDVKTRMNLKRIVS